MRLLAVARRRHEVIEPAALVTEILTGRPPRPLPASIVAALDRFDELGSRDGGTRREPRAALQ